MRLARRALSWPTLLPGLLLGALSCLPAFPQAMTAITATSVSAAGTPVNGTLCLTAVDMYRNPISVTNSSGAVYLANYAFCGQLTSGALAGTLSVPNSSTDSSPGHGYNILVYPNPEIQAAFPPSGTSTSSVAIDFGRGPVFGIGGSTWSLNSYVPPSTAPTAAAFTFTYGSGSAPSSCAPPAQDARLNTGTLTFYVCGLDGIFHVATSGAGSTGATGATGAAGDPGPPGPAGAAGSAGANGNTILSGTGIPGSGLGQNGDYYFDTASNIFYGPKSGGAWPSGISLVGPAGATGATGAAGAAGAGFSWQGAWNSATTYTLNQAVSYNGSSYVNLSASSLNQQPDTNPLVWEPLALEGAAGAAGAAGATGPPGVSGLTVGGAELVSFSATPTFSTSVNASRIVLTGNITTFTLGSAADGQLKTLCFQQGSGPYTVTAPSNVFGLIPLGVKNGQWYCQSFIYDATDSFYLPAEDQSPPAYAAATGSVNALVATFSPAVTALQNGLTVKVVPNLANTTTTPTLNVNGLGAVTITRNGTAALVAGDLTTTAIATLIYDGAHWQLQNPQTAPTSGNTTSTSLTPGYIPMANGGNSIINSHVDDGATTPGVVTSTEPEAVAGSTNGEIDLGYTGIAALTPPNPGVQHTVNSSGRPTFNPNATGALFEAGISSSAVSGDCAKFAANGIDLQDAGAACGTGSGPPAYIQPSTTVPTVASLTAVNQSTSTATDTAAGIYMVQPSTATQFVFGLFQTKPGTTWTYTAAIEAPIWPTSGIADGVCITDGTKIITFGAEYNGGAYPSPIIYYVTKWTSATAYSGDYTGLLGFPLNVSSATVWYRIQDDATNLTYSVSYDGVNFVPVKQTTRTDFLTTTKIGACVKAQNGAGVSANQTVSSWKATTP